MAAVLELRLTGGAANADPNLSLGGTMSSNQVAAGPLNNLFDNVAYAEASAGDVEYRAIDIYNSGDATAKVVELWIDSETPSTDSIIAVGLDSGTQSIPNEDTAPNSPVITFSHPLVGSKMSISDIANGSAQRLWIRRTISSSATNYADDLCGITIQYA